MDDLVTQATGHRRIAIVGVGPRGLVVFERLCAAFDSCGDGAGVTVFLIDDTRVGTGRVWRTDQSHILIMNTVASQVTVFADATVEMEGAPVSGPSLYEWATVGRYARFVVDLPPDLTDEAARITPDSYPSRVLYGHYLRWAFETVRARYASDRLDIVEIQDIASHVVSQNDRDYTLELQRRPALARLDCVVLTQGHLPMHADRSKATIDLARHASTNNLVYISHANTADVDLSTIQPGDSVIIRGLGLTFFDYLALLTEGRGGEFSRTSSGMTYRPSGREPTIFAGSRRGVPFHARGENQKGVSRRHIPLVLTPSRIAALRERAVTHCDLDFKRDIWPLIATEVETVFYTTLLNSRGVSDQEIAKFREDFISISVTEGAGVGYGPSALRVLERHRIEEKSQWNWDLIQRPAPESAFRSQSDYTQWLTDYLDRDVAEARRGNISSPLKAALDALRDLRNELRQIVDYGGITGDSFRRDVVDWYTPLNAFLSIGPPVSRIENLRALIAAGVVEVLAPDIRIHTESPTFHASSPRLPDREVHARALIEARLPDPNIETTRDYLLHNLIADGLARPFEFSNPDGSRLSSGGLDVDRSSHRLVNTSGRCSPGLYALGVPTESIRWVTAAGPRPYVNSVTFTDADAIAHHIVRASVPTAIELAR